MTDFSNSKLAMGSAFPVGAIDSAWGRLEPLLTPTQLVSRFLVGVPLVSGWRSPNVMQTEYNVDMMKDTIRRSVAMLEHDSKMIIMPTSFKERKPFDRQEFDSFGFFRLNHKPVTSVESLAIQDPNGNNIFTIPNGWIEPGFLTRGVLYIIPLSPGATGATFTALTGGSPFGPNVMQSLTANGVPGYWTCEYTAGFVDGNLPSIVNEAIGVYAALEILGVLGPTYARGGSHSLGIDGLSQSVSSPGAELFQVRIKELNDKRDKLLSRLKSMFGTKNFIGTL